MSHHRQRSEQDLNNLYNSYKSLKRKQNKSPLSNLYMQVGRYPLPKLMQDMPSNSDDCDASLSEFQNDLSAKYEKMQNFENVEKYNNPYLIMSRSPKYKQSPRGRNGHHVDRVRSFNIPQGDTDTILMDSLVTSDVHRPSFHVPMTNPTQMNPVRPIIN